MSGKIITIKCPQCGSTAHDEIRKDFYRCKSCSAQYFFDDKSNNQIFNNSTDNDFINTDTQIPDDSKVYSQTNSAVSKNSKRIILLVAGIFSIGMITPIIIGVIVARDANKNISNSSISGSGTKSYMIMGSDSYILASVTKKNPLVIRLENRYNTGGERNINGEIYYVFINPQSGDIIKEEKITDASSGIPQFKFNSFSNGKTYVIIDDSQLYEINTENLTLTEENNRITTTTPELNSGIATIQFLSNENGDGYRIFNNNGKYYNYFPTIKKLYTDEALETAKISYNPSDDFYIDDFYFTFGEISTKDEVKSELLKINYKRYPGGPEYLENTPRKYAGEHEYFHRRGSRNRIISINAIEQDRLFFAPKVLYFDNENIIIAFKPSANPKAKFSIQKIDPKTNTIIWTLPNQELAYNSRAVRIKNGFLLNSAYNTFLGISSEGKELYNFKLQN